MTTRLYLKNANQKDAYSSPWSRKEAILVRVWEVVWNIAVRWMPKITSRWYVFLLKLFGCKISGKPYVAPTCRIYAPWLLTLKDHCALGSRSEVYNLGPVIIGAKTTVAQYVYLCNGTHDFSNERMPLIVGTMVIGEKVFVGAKSIILPGLTIGDNAIIGAGAVLTHDAEAWGIYGGNPARFIKWRVMKEKIF